MLIVDTAGRMQIDADLMDEMRAEEAAESAGDSVCRGRDDRAGRGEVGEGVPQAAALTGVVLTKMDGDARGGAALSIRQVTGQPIKFMGTGEKPDAFEPFHPDRIVGRIIGMGDIMTLLEHAEEKLDREKAEQFAQEGAVGRRIFAGGFSRSVAADQKLGSMKTILKMLPSVGPFAGMQQMAENVDERQFTRVEAIINSMTEKERERPRDHHRQPAEADRERVGDDGAGGE